MHVFLKTTSNFKLWWNQFPPELRLITKARVLASIGAGGVLYLTPIVFNSLSLSATQIGEGIAIAAIAGTLTRLMTGFYLDKNSKISVPLKVAASFALIADLILLIAKQYHLFLLGEFFLGAAAGVYWPSIELAIPLACSNFKSSKGFALARSADALGVSVGTMIGSLAAFFGQIRSIYLVEGLCMLLLINILNQSTLLNKKNTEEVQKINNKNVLERLSSLIKEIFILIPNLSPLLVISLFSTGMLSLLQSALPLDLVIGGIKRTPILESQTALLIALKLIILLIIQWPIGNWLSKRKFEFGLMISCISFSFGSFLLGLSSLYKNGIPIMLFGLIFISIGLASFLPTATEAVIKISPLKQRGISMSIYSQCFGISAFIAPWIGGKLIDVNQHATYLWIGISICFILILPLIQLIKIKKAFN